MNWPWAKQTEDKSNKSLKKLVGYLMARNLVAQYDSLKWRGEVLRKRPEIRTDYSETEQIFSGERRILAYAQADDLMDNCSVGSTVATAIRLTIGTVGGTPLFEGESKEADKFFFERWAADCGFAEGETLQEMLELILFAVKVHGDCIVKCDAATDFRVRVWDADQIVNIGDFADWRRKMGLSDKCREIEGVVVDEEGRVMGYFVTARRNVSAVNSEDATFLPFSLCKRVSYHKKITQYRGEPSIISMQETTSDTKELVKSEVAAAKLASELSLIVEQPAGIDKGQISGVLEGFASTKPLTDGTDISDDDLAELTEATRDDKTFKAFEGHSAIASVPNGTKVTNLNNASRPAQTIQAWLDRLDDVNGKALGMMSCLSRGRADNSYSSGQIEVEISWQQFKRDQKMLSEVVDYCLANVMPHAAYSLQWPEAFSIDPEKDEKVKDMRLRGGRTTYRQLLGPNYKAILTQLADEKRLLEKEGLTNLAFFQSAAGAVIPAKESEENATKEKENENR